MSLSNKGLPNFNQLISDHKIKNSRQDLINVLKKDSDNNSQKFIVENFENDSYDTINEYIKKQLEYVETAINNDVAFTFGFVASSNRGKKTFYGLPYCSQEKLEKHGTSNTLMFINILYELNDILDQEKKLVLRDIYYKNVDIYDKKQTNFNFVFEKLMTTLNVDRQAFKIGAAQKGEYYTHQNLNIMQDDNPSVLIKGKNLVPNSVKYKMMEQINITNIENTINLLIVEKDAVFSDIVDNIGADFLKKWVIVTGRGQPDKLTLNFVCGLSNCSQIGKIFVLTDLDPYGIYIGLNYMNSILEFTEMNKAVCRRSSIKYLGVKLFDILFNKRNYLNNENVNKILITFQSKDYRIATNCVQRLISNKYLDTSDSIKDLLTETQRQIFFGFKVEINSLNNGDVCSWLTSKNSDN